MFFLFSCEFYNEDHIVVPMPMNNGSQLFVLQDEGRVGLLRLGRIASLPRTVWWD